MIDKAKYIEVSAGVRYWEDARLNGEEDTDGKVPLRNGNYWEPVICLQTGAVQSWPQEMTADIHYKVCDNGEYWLLDADKNRIAKWNGSYVPNDFLCVDDHGYGDYIIFQICENGKIMNWVEPDIDPGQWGKLP